MAKTLNTSFGLTSNGSLVRPPYGKGARTYGGQFVQGRENQAQVKIQNTGYSPSEDYRAAPYLPGLWKDLDRNGCPYVLEKGTVVGASGVSDGTNVRTDVHFVSPANAGIPQTPVYTTDDIGIAVDIDAQDPDAAVAACVKTAVATAQAAQTNVLAGNKPLAFISTPVLSSAWELRFSNQRFEHQAPVLTHDLVMYPVADGFMYGGSFTASTSTASLISGSVVTPGYTGVTDVSIADGSYALTGIQAGDKVMPNPYLPGRLISVGDFVKMALTDTVLKAKVEAAITADFGITTVIDDNATPASEAGLGALVAYAMQHVVGTCFKRQTRATYDQSEGVYVGHDIYSDSYRFYDSAEELATAGANTDGIEADQIVASDYAKAAGDAQTADVGVDVVFINYNIK